MKKNISINISSIIFHIEEDGYEVLKNYLESINTYFSKFEDKTEIVSDIENRIAEIFLGKTSPSKQVITLGDVLSLISTMGTIADFAAIEDTEDPLLQPEHSSGQKEYTTTEEKAETHSTKEEGAFTEPNNTEQRRLHRNTSKKILGGVASGIASQFNVDPLWIRLLFILIFISGASSGFKALAFGTVITYIILWIIVPASTTVEENKRIKKLYRNPEKKVLGGVASGMAAYFGTDALVFRILFLMTIFLGGTGFIVYIIFWIITPEARSITDKIQMQGDAVTLTNIENNVKKNSNPIEETESPLSKILLLPFRLIAIVFSGLAKIIEPLFKFLIEAIRVFIGIILIVAGMALLISLLVITGYLLGLYNGEDYFFTADFPSHIYLNSIPKYALILIFGVLFIPALSIILSGFSAIRKENTISSSVGWSLFILWILCVILASATVPGWIQNFQRSGNYEFSERYSVGDKTLFLTVNNIGSDPDGAFEINYGAVGLNLIGYNENELKVVKNFKARGKTSELANQNASHIDYRITKKDSSLIFDRNLRFEENDVFLVQEALVNLYIPYNTPFVIDKNLQPLLSHSLSRQINNGGEDKKFVFDENGLKCIDCNNFEEE